MTKGDGAGSAASEREEDDNTTDQSDQLMSRFSDILCFVLFSSSVSSFLLLRFCSEKEGRKGSEEEKDSAHAVYLYPTLTGSSSRRGAYTSGSENLRASSPRTDPQPAGGAGRRRRIHASRFNELFIYFQVDIDDQPPRRRGSIKHERLRYFERENPVSFRFVSARARRAGLEYIGARISGNSRGIMRRRDCRNPSPFRRVAVAHAARRVSQTISLFNYRTVRDTHLYPPAEHKVA